MSVFGENDSRRLSNFLETHIFWKFDHISRTYNQINYRNIWFAKVTIILIMMAQVLFFDIFSEKDPHLNAVEYQILICLERWRAGYLLVKFCHYSFCGRWSHQHPSSAISKNIGQKKWCDENWNIPEEILVFFVRYFLAWGFYFLDW